MPSCQQREKFLVIESVMAVQLMSPASGVRRVWRIGKASHVAISSILRHFYERITVDDDNGISHCMHSADTRYNFLTAKVGVKLWV
jgi:ERCC4-type nuclease